MTERQLIHQREQRKRYWWNCRAINEHGRTTGHRQWKLNRVNGKKRNWLELLSLSLASNERKVKVRLVFDDFVTDTIRYTAHDFYDRSIPL